MSRPDINMDDLSFDAKVVAGACFGTFGTKSTMTFQMVESKPGPRAQVALDELVSAGVLSVEPANGRGGVTYRALHDCHDAFKWVMGLRGDDAARMKFPISVPIAEPAA